MYNTLYTWHPSLSIETEKKNEWKGKLKKNVYETEGANTTNCILCVENIWDGIEKKKIA